MTSFNSYEWFKCGFCGVAFENGSSYIEHRMDRSTGHSWSETMLGFVERSSKLEEDLPDEDA